MKETREQKIGRKGLSYFGDSKRFFIEKKGHILLISPMDTKWQKFRTTF